MSEKPRKRAKGRRRASGALAGGKTKRTSPRTGRRAARQGASPAADYSPPHLVTPFYEEQIRRNGHPEALRRIVEPSPEELRAAGRLDTSGEHEDTVVPGLQHKYARTGLILVTNRCYAYCRFCFRKRMIAHNFDEVALDYAAIAAYVRQHPEMNDVLLSGGDPFRLSTAQLHGILDPLLPVPHLKSVRFGTKAPVYDPARFADPELPGLFERILNAGKEPVIVLHVDHPGELSAECEVAVRRLRGIGVQFLHQAVLMNGVNDDPEVLATLMARLHAVGVRPYYLFQARPVKGATHFQVPLARGVEIVRQVNRLLNGLEKTFRYIMSHATGKIEILDLAEDGRLYMRYHQCKDAGRIGRLFSRPYREGACWLDDLPAKVAGGTSTP
jgi:KamA family protein